MFHQAIVRIRAGTKTDRGGNQIKDWSPAAVDRLPVGRLSIHPNLQTEHSDATRTAVASGWYVISEPGSDADIRAEDRIEWSGMTLDVAGEVGRYSDPGAGTVHHIEFAMRRVTG